MFNLGSLFHALNSTFGQNTTMQMVKFGTEVVVKQRHEVRQKREFVLTKLRNLR